MSRKSDLEERYAAQLAEAGITGYERQYRFCPPRLWRIDFAFVYAALAVEIEGTPSFGGKGSFVRDQVAEAERSATLALLGWRVLRVPAKWLTKPRDTEGDQSEAIRWTRALLGERARRR